MTSHSVPTGDVCGEVLRSESRGSHTLDKCQDTELPSHPKGFKLLCARLLNGKETNHFSVREEL